MRVFKTVVRQIENGWEFRWVNIGGGTPPVFGSRIYLTEAEAIAALDEFKRQELERHPDTTKFVESLDE